MDERAKTLSETAQLDAELFELRKVLRNFPRRLEEAGKQLVAEEKLLAEVETPWNDLEYQVSEKEATIQVALDTITKFEEHIKRVTTQKEYMAAKKQVEEARRLNRQLQDEILEAGVKQEELAPKLKEVREHHGNVLEAYQEEESRIAKEKEEVARQMTDREAQVQSRLSGLDADFLIYYQRLVKGGKLPAIVPATTGTCGGCNMAIPPQYFNLMIANPMQVHTCSSCNRIVFYQPAEEEQAEDSAPAEASAAEAATGT
ncbi:MAG: C4-type zinc ribbon domain-containing protein [SAR324 cluster bacterium]|nr:C4-type zinc ribbon domain-containing protein [SAR324 cluster bacterium]